MNVQFAYIWLFYTNSVTIYGFKIVKKLLYRVNHLGTDIHVLI